MIESNYQPKTTRSHAGCTRCKKRRQKCDEGKPGCGRCSQAQTPCFYAVCLRWGGRAFDRSRFGDCLKSNVRRINDDKTTTSGFVYGASARGSVGQLSLSPPLYNIQSLPWLSFAERGLLYHFTTEASRITCCHPNIQQELCRLIVPMAMDSKALMYATLSWAAIHRVAFHGTIEGVRDSERFIAILKGASIRNLRLEIQLGSQIDILLATVRTLCQAEIHAGTDNSSAWRVHVNGARALMLAEKSQSSSRGTPPRLLQRWFSSLESLARLSPSKSTALTGNNFAIVEDIYLDDYNGYSTDLSMLLGKIGFLARRMDRGEESELQSFVDEVQQLETCLDQIIARDSTLTPAFFPGVVEKLSPEAIFEYSMCNQAYQHTALIYIHRRLRRLPGNMPTIQTSVKTIIKCVHAIKFTYGLSPAIVLTTPLFTAGCEAFGQDREEIRELLFDLYTLLKIRNIMLAIRVLEASWAEATGDDADNALRQEGWDFIPY